MRRDRHLYLITGLAPKAHTTVTDRRFIFLLIVCDVGVPRLVKVMGHSRGPTSISSTDECLRVTRQLIHDWLVPNEKGHIATQGERARRVTRGTTSSVKGWYSLILVLHDSRNLCYCPSSEPDVHRSYVNACSRNRR